MTQKEFIFIVKRDETKIAFDFDKTVKELLTAFLQKTNSIITFDCHKIFFTFGDLLLNQKEQILNSCLNKIFGRTTKLVIRVTDKSSIIGGL